MLFMVDRDTLPKPTAKIVMPLLLTLDAVAIAAADPEYCVLCSPSLKSTSTLGRAAELLSSMPCALVRPAPMLVLPDVEYDPTADETAE